MKAPKLKFICFSDLHLGEEESLLTNLIKDKYEVDPLNPSPVMLALREALTTIIRDSSEFPLSKPKLILLGDILDFGLSLENLCLMVFERFMETFFIDSFEPLFEEIIYIPGNHDHHLWETAREIQYAEYIKRHKGEKRLPIPWHRTRAIPQKPSDYINSPLLESSISRVLQQANFSLKVNILYPNFILHYPEKNKFIIFHHGHFFEKIYYLISYLKSLIFPEEIEKFPPSRVDDIEAENFAWIDFFWSALGRSGEAGEKVDTLWEWLQSKDGREKIIKNLSKGLAQSTDIPLMPDKLENFLEEKTLQILLKFLIESIYKRLEKHLEEELSKDYYKFLKNYIGKCIYHQIKNELNGEEQKIKDSEIVLVFGHTHKPLSYRRKIEPFKRWVRLYNTGGWTSHQPKLNPIYGGMPVFIDEEGNIVGLKIFSLGQREKPYPLEIHSSGKDHSNLYTYLSQKIEAHLPVWEKLTDIIQREAEIRAANLRKKTES